VPRVEGLREESAHAIALGPCIPWVRLHFGLFRTEADSCQLMISRLGAGDGVPAAGGYHRAGRNWLQRKYLKLTKI